MTTLEKQDSIQSMTNSPFITFITRCCYRPNMMRIAINSALAQTDRDFEIVLIPDMKKRGVKWANKQFGLNTNRVDGRYVYTLDDDSKIVDRELIKRLKKISTQPGIVMVKCYRPQIAPHILPKPYVWGQRDKLRVATTNGGCFIVRADVWKRHAHAYGIPGSGDWNFLSTVKRDRSIEFFWVNVVAKEPQQLGRGKKFEKCGKGWLNEVVKEFGFKEVAPGDWRLRGMDWKKRVVAVKKPVLAKVIVAKKKKKKKKKTVLKRITKIPSIMAKRVPVRRSKKNNETPKHSLPSRR